VGLWGGSVPLLEGIAGEESRKGLSRSRFVVWLLYI
jgi:hypothetical protein